MSHQLCPGRTVCLHAKASFRRDLLDVHCHQILFGGTTDNGYARLLAPLVGDDTTCRRVTLLEGPPFAQELACIKHSFHSIPFGKVFRTQKLVNLKRTVPQYPSPPRTPPTECATNTTEESSSLASDSASPAGSAVFSEPGTDRILHNKQGQRVDTPLVYSSKDFADLKSRKLCNSFHLLGRCTFLGNYGNCSHDHEARLNRKQVVVLRAISRQSPCRLGLECKDPNCIRGHRCTQRYCVRANCWFPPEMHNVDTSVVTKT